MGTHAIVSCPNRACTATAGSPAWFAVHTSSRHEKQVALHFEGRGIEHLLPVYEEVRRWVDRQTKVTLPLFPGYLFARISLDHRMDVLQVPGVARIVGSRGVAVPVHDYEIEALQRGISNGVRLEPHPYLRVGKRVRVTAGPMRGTEGILQRVKDSLRVVVSVDLIMRSVAVEVDAADIRPA